MKYNSKQMTGDKPPRSFWQYSCICIVQKAQLFCSSIHTYTCKRSETICCIRFHCFYFSFENPKLVLIHSVIYYKKKTMLNLCFRSFYLNAVRFFVYCSIYRNTSDQHAYSMGFYLNPAKKLMQEKRKTIQINKPF